MNTDSISTSPDQKEGYICPSCRLLFSTIPHVGGNGVVCPGCRKLLTVPNEEDGIASQNTNQVRYKPAGLASVDQLEDAYRQDRQWQQERHEQMMQIESQDKELRWMVPLALVAVVLLGGLGFVLLSPSDKKPVMVASPVENQENQQLEASEMEVKVEFEHNDPKSFEALSQYLEKVLAAETVDELLSLVRPTENLREKMVSYYKGEKVTEPDLNELLLTAEQSQHPGYFSARFEDRDFETRDALIKFHDGSFELDWESFVSYSDLRWDQMKKQKPTQPFVMRVSLSVKDFYLGDFSDDRIWQSVSMTNPNEEGTMYGYVKRKTAVEQLVSNFGMTTSDYLLTVRARYPENATGEDQVEIIEVISDSWLVEEK